jgi:acyl-CoA thioesterase-1
MTYRLALGALLYLLAFPLAASEPLKTIVCLGDSITAGYGLDINNAYPARLQDKVLEAGLAWRVVNAGVSGDTTSGALTRLNWILKQPINVLVIALGGNDGLRGFDPEITYRNLGKIIDQTRAKYPDVKIVLAGMQMPTNFGEAYTRKFKALYPALAQQKNVALVPFLLDGVGGIDRLNQADQIHPTSEGQKIVAANIWKVLGPVLNGNDTVSKTNESTPATGPSPENTTAP